MSVFEALAFLDTLVDDSDPDIELSQLQHLLQTSEAIREDGHEEWFVLTGLLHDLGKVRLRRSGPALPGTGEASKESKGGSRGSVDQGSCILHH